MGSSALSTCRKTTACDEPRPSNPWRDLPRGPPAARSLDSRSNESGTWHRIDTRRREDPRSRHRVLTPRGSTFTLTTVTAKGDEKHVDSRPQKFVVLPVNNVRETRRALKVRTAKNRLGCSVATPRSRPLRLRHV